MDEPNSIEGMDILAAWMDEAGLMKQESWINVQGRLSMSKGRCIITSTPYAINWFYRDVYLNKDNPEFDIIAWNSTDNPKFPKDEVERMKKSLPKAIFERRYLGKFTRLEGLVYAEFDEDFHVVEPFDIPDDWVCFGGLDFGRSNPNAIVCIAQDISNNTFYVYKEFYRSETLLQTISQFLHNEKMSYVLADTQSAQLIAELQQFHGNKNVKEADKTIDVGIERVRSLLQEGRLKFFRDRCPRTLDEIKQYHYAASTGERDASEKPVAKDNHAMDALRYAFSRPMQGLYAHRAKKKVSQRFSRRLVEADPFTGY
jgi:PBSX family phage terminase large subunit